MFDDALPASQLERAKMLEGFLIGRATGDLTNNQDAYSTLRRKFIDDPKLGSLLPDFVRINRTLDMFWPFIKSQADNYAERRRIILGRSRRTILKAKITRPLITWFQISFRLSTVPAFTKSGRRRLTAERAIPREP
jgi:hypothetical protein